MKNFIILVVVLFCLIIMSNETKAQCPDGYSYTQETLNIGGCFYSVELCYTCRILVEHNANVILKSFRKLPTIPECNNNMTTDEVLAEINNQIKTIGFFQIILGCPPFQPAPCDTSNWDFVTYKTPTCLQKTMMPDSTMKFEGCPSDTTKCVIIYKYCWDPIEEIIVANVHEHYYEGNGMCPPGQEPADPTVVWESSTCFGVITPCEYY